MQLPCPGRLASPRANRQGSLLGYMFPPCQGQPVGITAMTDYSQLATRPIIKLVLGRD